MLSSLHLSYKNDTEIMAMTNLVGAFQRKEIKEFEQILKGIFFKLGEGELSVKWVSPLPSRPTHHTPHPTPF